MLLLVFFYLISNSEDGSEIISLLSGKINNLKHNDLYKDITNYENFKVEINKFSENIEKYKDSNSEIDQSLKSMCEIFNNFFKVFLIKLKKDKNIIYKESFKELDLLSLNIIEILEKIY